MMKKTTLDNLKKKFKNKNITKSGFIKKAMDIHRYLFDYIEITKNSEIRKIIISPQGLNFVIGKKNLNILIPQEESRVAPLEIVNFGSYEKKENFILNLFSKNSKEILDIGANIGYYSMHFATHNPKAIIYAFEPLKSSFSYLKQNIDSNKLQTRVKYYNLGLSNFNGKAKFYIPLRNSTNASMKNVSRTKNYKKIIAKISTLDDWCYKKKIKPNFIKCDVEGAELFVFEGAKKIIEKNKPLIFTELLRKWSKPYGYHPNDLIFFFEKIDYLCFGIGKNKAKLIKKISEKTKETNYVFIHSKLHSNIKAKLLAAKW